MIDVTLQKMTSEQVIEMGDGLLAGGFFAMAKELYGAALRHESRTAMRFRLRLRMGLAGDRRTRSQKLLQDLKRFEAEDSQVFVSAGMITWMKNIPFLDDERFMALEEKHQHLLPIPNWHWNLQTVVWALHQTRDVEGDLVEMGVFKGHTTLFCAEYHDFQDWPKRWVLFDTFDGIPDDQVDAGWEQVNTSTYKGTYSYEDTRDRFAGYPNIEVIQGRVPEILQDHCPEKVSFLHIDLNNTTAEIAALEFTLDRLSPGGVLILDDYCWAPARAQFLAERQWFGERGLHVLPLPTGQGVFIKR
ncbi:TylF/MycF/NovP-related O-methyltransferase [Phenylobacterium sp.]|uniref:TylF/MycF/NovP-related O-methyltransferase n=1 Tax=Phenylobacterium sp. TaxID=1871053 RepID=UPI00120FA224|nr:TylF/MycF/NovP-related O-methyltransferase [Phenylobacterium sp.]THD57781.1 MAG: hypothetical protein E8A49_21485 [Phenylobacterium sp.]